jgi:hypothetical protein
LLVWPHDEPKRVRCWLRPTSDVFRESGARSVTGPKRAVEVENTREAGVREWYVRVSGDALRNEPWGRPASISLVVMLPCPIQPAFLKEFMLAIDT